MAEKQEKLKLHIGCGRQRLRGYINIDKYSTPATDVVTEAWRLRGPPLDCTDNTVDEIFTSHMIEHLTLHDLDTCLKEWHRVLKPGGRLKIKCPNFELYVREWLEGDYWWRWGWGIINLFGHTDRGPGMMHRTGFTKKRLQRLLEAAGFATHFCGVTATRPFTRGTVEFRIDGDLSYEGAKVARIQGEFRRHLAGHWEE